MAITKTVKAYETNSVSELVALIQADLDAGTLGDVDGSIRLDRHKIDVEDTVLILWINMGAP